jgi:hypothetical protein
MNHGLVLKPRPTDWIKDQNSKIVLRGLGISDWTPYWNFNENQRNPLFDTDGCAVYSAHKVLDAWMDYLISQGQIAHSDVAQFLDTGLDGLLHFHSSPWFTENLTGNGSSGNSEGECYDVIKKYGVIPYTEFPFTQTTTPQEYFIQPSATQLATGKAFLAFMGGSKFLQYHLIANNTPKNFIQLQEAITQSPLNLGINVDDAGWNQVVPLDPPDLAPVHAVTTFKIVPPNVPVSDNYVPYDKTLDAGYPINYVTQAIVTFFPYQEKLAIQEATLLTDQIATQPVAQRSALYSLILKVVQALQKLFA